MRSWKTWVGFALSALLLWWTLKGVEASAVWGVLRTSNAWLFATCTVVATCIFRSAHDDGGPFWSQLPAPCRSARCGVAPQSA